MSFVRGFKAHANRLALEVREELGLTETSPLCPWSLAESLAISVIPLSSLRGESRTAAIHVDYLSAQGSSSFSAITVFRGYKRLIVHNDAHAPTRQRSNLAHEIAHALLHHPPHPPFCSAGQRVFDSALEAEAGWMGPVLLVSNEAARWAVAECLTELDAARHFGVSVDLMKFRLSMSGAAHIVRRRRN